MIVVFVEKKRRNENKSLKESTFDPRQVSVLTLYSMKIKIAFCIPNLSIREYLNKTVVQKEKKKKEKEKISWILIVVKKEKKQLLFLTCHITTCHSMKYL